VLRRPLERIDGRAVWHVPALPAERRGRRVRPGGRRLGASTVTLDPAMSTRKLIIAAMLCGLAILVAATVQFMTIK